MSTFKKSYKAQVSETSEFRSACCLLILTILGTVMIAALMLERFYLTVVSNSVNFIHAKIRVVSAVKTNQEEGTENQSVSEEMAD